jgi:hypothetical protein
MNASRENIDLIDPFARDVDSYYAGQHNESHVRREFIDPCFKCAVIDPDHAAAMEKSLDDFAHKVGDILEQMQQRKVEPGA